MDDACIISDIHLGSAACRVDAVLEVLHSLNTKLLVINGDLFEHLEARLKKGHWKVLSVLRKLADDIKVVFLVGNHDRPTPYSIANLLGVEILDEYQFESGGKKVLCTHGDRWDNFVSSHRVLTYLGDKVYNFLQWLDKSHHYARLAKRSSKTFLRCTERVRYCALDYAKEKGVDAIICGHTHHVENWSSETVYYYNGGCFTESPSTYLTVKNGKVTVKEVK